MKRMAAVFAAAHVTIAASVALADLSADQTPFHTYRGLWVSRFEYSNTQSSVDSIFANAQALGITDVMFQVRGQADAYYDSKIVNGNYFEHRASTSFDALARAIQQGQQRGIKVHAWLNAMPLWNGTSLPSDQPGNPYVINTHPEYWIRNSGNTPQPLNSGYVIVNPTQPDVKQHIYEVVDDITSKYAVDGIHLDYIRFYHATSGGTPITYPTDPASLARFQSIPGNAGKTPVSHKAEYQQWMADNITDLVSGIRQGMKSNRPNAQLTAAIWRDANIGYDDYQQDWKTWVDRGLLDAGMPMIYRKGFGTGGAGMSSDSGDLYRNNVTAAVNWRGNAGIMPGLGIYLQDDAATAYGNVLAQLNYARDRGANGVQLFSYSDLVGTGAVDLEVQRAWNDFRLANNIAPPVASITNFEVDEGYFPTNITFSGSNVNVAATSTADRTTEDAHSSVASQKLTINKVGAGTFLARHLSGIGTPGSPGSNITFRSIGAVGFWLKTTNSDIEVALAVDDVSDNSSSERGYFQNVIPDGQWHSYEWLLNDVSHWDLWAGANDDGTVEQTFTLDSIQLRGSELTNVLFLDDIFFDAAATAPNQWTLDSSINTNSTDTNWTNAANWQGGVPNAVGAAANLLRRATTAQTVTVGAPITLGSLTFDNVNSYTLSGSGSIMMDTTAGDASIAVRNRGSHTISVPIHFTDNTDLNVDHAATLNVGGSLNNLGGRSLTKSGNGVLNINGPQVHGPGAIFNAIGGTTNFNTDAGAPGAANLNLVATGASTRVNLNVDQHLASLDITSGAKVDAVSSFITIDYVGATPVANVRSMIASAYSGGAWTGSGLTSSIADAAHGVGFTDDGNLITLHLTRYGDADLSGNVNLADFNRLASNFGAGGAFWFMGDFNYDALVNLADFNLLAANFGLAASPDGPTPQDWANLASVVPEPGAAGRSVLLSLLLRRRRREPAGPARRLGCVAQRR